MGSLVASSITLLIVLGTVEVIKIFARPDYEMHHKLHGLVYKIVKIESKKDSGEFRYAFRVYRFWGLVPSKWYLTAGSEAGKWSPCILGGQGKYMFTTLSAVEDMVEKLTPITKRTTVTATSVEEIKMEKLLES